MKLFRFLLCVALLGCSSVRKLEAARILGLFQLNIKSHFIMFEALLKGLAAKGHDVVVLSHFPQKNPITSYTDISIQGSLPDILNTFTLDYAINQRYDNLLYFVWNLNVKFCEKVYEHPEVQRLIKSDDKFDLVITESFGVDCFTAFAHKFQAPHITMTSAMAMPWADDDFGNPNHPAYIPIFFLAHTDRMNFQQRLLNTLVWAGLKLGRYYFAEMPMQELVQKHFGHDIPSLRDIARNTSLLFANSHFSNIPRPMVPAVVEVGGLHIGVPKKLPKDLENFIEGAKAGVIYFSLGSLVRSETFHKEKLRALLDAFSELPQRVLWKVDNIPGLPTNVMTSKWLPQFDILSHPNVRVFITHGGCMGTQEAIYNGVPMIGIPLYSDQHHNVENYVSKNVAVKLDYYEINKESVSHAIRTILENPTYQENARRLSQIFRDRPQTAMNAAIFWTEYVIRHKGAPHLRSAAVDLYWYQYLLLDIQIVLIIIAITFSLILYLAFRKLASFLMRCLPDKQGRTKTSKLFKSQ